MKNTIIIILSLLVIGLGSYVIFDKVIDKSSNNSVADEKNKQQNGTIDENVENSNSENTAISLTSEQAFKLIETKRKNLNYDTWRTLNAKVTKKGDDNYFYVTYTEANVDGGNSSLGVIFHYENGNWHFELPGFSGHGDLSKYNFVDVDSKEYFELSDDLAYVLIEGKRNKLGYDTWKTSNVKVTKKGDDNYFYVTYTEANVDGGNSSLGVIFHYENGNWNFELPGFSGHGDLSKYNFVDLQ